jgi:hypothetical protein
MRVGRWSQFKLKRQWRDKRQRTKEEVAVGVRKGRKEGAVSRRGDNEKNPSTYKKGKAEKDGRGR